MGLRIRGWRKITKAIVWFVLIVVFSVFLIKVMVFEHNYYNEKEGSERAVAEVEYEEQALDENKPTESETAEYSVSPDRPRYLSIDKLDIKNARILPMGINSKGELNTPVNIFDVGWYEGSSKPGKGGTLVIDGHNGGPTKFGVFKKLPGLVQGDVIVIERGDGAKFKYKVVENNTVSLNEADAYMSIASTSPVSGKESLTLISCTGDWLSERRTYSSRQFLRAVIEE